MNRRAPVLAVSIACALWGTSFLFGWIALREMSVPHVVFYRFALAAVILAWIVARSPHRPARRDLPLIALTGFLAVPVTLLLQFAGLERTTVTAASLLIGTGAPLLALAALAFHQERAGSRVWLAITISTIGVGLMVGLPGGGDPFGNVLVFLSMISSTAWILLTNRITRRYPAGVATGWILLAGTAFLVPITLAWSGLPPVSMSGPAWASIGALALVCTVASFVLWNWGATRMQAGRAGVFLNLEPVVGAMTGLLLLGEVLSPGLVAGGGLVLLSAGLVSTAS